jgi:pyruvate dehydrogenase E2 component (dihydrolipoamide acetyltransferase)
MPVSIVMPALEMAQETGKLVSWLKREGEPVRKGEMLLEVETDKAVVEVEAAGDGILAGVTAKPGDVVQVGRTIAWLVQPGETLPSSGSSAGGPSHARISPKARRLAQERGIDIASLKGSGAGGEILADDVLGAAASVAPAANRPEGLTTIGRLMAERTTQSWTTVPHFFVTRDVDAGGLNRAREGTTVTLTDLLIAIVARVLKKHPRLNASWTAGGIVSHEEVNIGVAVAVENAVVTAVIPRADRAAPADIAIRRRDLTERARAGRLQPADIAGATFTISNLGMFGVDTFTAIIVPPQAAILAVGAIADRVVAVDGKPEVRPMMTLTLSCDHRVVDGVRAAEFMLDLAAAIRSPQIEN